MMKNLKKIVVLVLIITISFLYSTSIMNVQKSSLSNSEENTRVKQAEVISPILIDDTDPSHNWSITAMTYEWCSGSGNSTHPYTIENVSIDGGNSSACILIRNSRVHFVIRDCTVTNSASGTWVYYLGGILLDNVTNGKIIDNDCSNNHGHGIRLWNGINNITITGNTINNNDLHGIYLLTGNNNNISDNSAIGNGNSGILISSSNSWIYENSVSNSGGRSMSIGGDYNNCFKNTITNSQDSGIYLSGNYNNVIENIIINNRQDGISVRGASFNNVTNNLVQYNNVDDGDFGGIFVFQADENLINKNKITNNNGYGIRVRDCTENILTENDIKYCSKMGVLINSSAANNLIFLNNFTHNGINAINDAHNDWDNGVIGNYWDDYVGIDKDGDGCGEEPYSVPGAVDNKDNFPITFNQLSYQLGIKVGNVFTWQVTVVNETGMEEVFGSDWYTLLGVGDSNKTGAQLKLIITDITTVDNEWEISYNISIWTIGEFLFFDELGTTVAIWPKDFSIFLHSSHFIPIPLIDYLENSQFPAGYSSDKNQVTYSGIFNTPFTLILTFNRKSGCQVRYQILNHHEQVIYEYVLMGGDASISAGHFYLVFVLIAVISLVIVHQKIHH